jgi:hypothetical protein
LRQLLKLADAMNPFMARAPGSQKKPLQPQERAVQSGEELTDMKLYAAQEILAEVFGISRSEAEEMIKQRSRERMLWPERFSADITGD